MSVTENKRTITLFADEFFSKGNYGVKDQIYAPGYVDHTPMFGLPPTADGVEQALRTLRAAFPDQKATVSEIVPVDEDAAVVFFKIEATHKGAFGGMPATGRHVEYPGLSFVRFAADGRCIESWIFRDDLELFRQLGALPASTQVSPTQQPAPPAI